MTKRHFVALADAIRRTQPNSALPVGETEQAHARAGGRAEQWRTMRDALADFCQSQNAQFDRERWLAYIAGESGPNNGRTGRTKGGAQ